MTNLPPNTAASDVYARLACLRPRGEGRPGIGSADITFDRALASPEAVRFLARHGNADAQKVLDDVAAAYRAMADEVVTE